MCQSQGRLGTCGALPRDGRDDRDGPAGQDWRTAQVRLREVGVLPGSFENLALSCQVTCWKSPSWRGVSRTGAQCCDCPVPSSWPCTAPGPWTQAGVSTLQQRVLRPETPPAKLPICLDRFVYHELQTLSAASWLICPASSQMDCPIGGPAAISWGWEDGPEPRVPCI